MEQIFFKPALYKFAACKAFADQFALGGDDLVLTNGYIFDPYFSQMELKCRVVYLERYGTGEPTDLMAEAILRDVSGERYKRIVAVGGGSIIDLAKVIAVADGADVDKLYDNMPDLNKRMELVIVPTTCGTGSEMTNIAVLNRTRLGTKMGLASPAMYADAAVLIPELLEGLPFAVFATSSIDALIHAVESSLSPKATDFTKLFGYKAIEIIIKGYQVIAAGGAECRIGLMEGFLTASCYAGLAFGTAGCAAVHAMSYPLGGKYHVAHGESNYAMFAGVMRGYMKIKQDGEIAVMNQYLAELLGCSAECVYEALEALLNQILPRKALREYGVTPEDLPQFAQSVVKSQTRLTNNNFVPLSYDKMLEIYQELY